MIPFNMLVENDYRVAVSYDGDLTSVVIIDPDTGLHARGHARCDVNDEYDFDFGNHLAYIRAASRLMRKLEKVYSRGVSVIENTEPRR